MTPRPARLPGTPVRAVLLDYGGTLVTFARPGAALADAYGEIARTLARRLPPGARIPAPEDLLAGVHDRVEAAVAEHDARRALEEIDLEPVYRDAYAALCGAAPDGGLLDEVVRLEQRAWFAGVRVDPDAVSTLTALRGAGLRVGLCSNAPYHAATLREQLDAVGLAGLLDAAVLSSDAGRRKPARELFDAALAALGARAHDAVHVGDRLAEDVEGARAAGLRTVWLAPSTADAAGSSADAVVARLCDLVPLLLG